MSQPLGNFVPKPAQTGDQFQARFALGRPLLVQVVAVDGARQVAGQNGQPASVKKAITVHVWDLVGGQISVNDQGMPVHGAPNTVYCNVLWMAGAVVDNLEPYVGAPAMPLKLLSQKNKQGTFSYLTPVAIEGPELQQVQAVFAADPTRIDREAAARAQASAAQAAAPAYQQSGFTPMQVQPSAPAQQVPNGYQPQGGQYPQQAPAQQAPADAQFQPVPQGYQQAPAAAQFQAPPGQPGAIASIPAQVAQQWAPVDQAMQQAAAQFQPPAQQWAPVDQAQQAPNGYQQPVQGQPQFQQAPAQVAQPGIGHVQNSDVANILQGLAGQTPQPQG
jgi:hypothetical protein